MENSTFCKSYNYKKLNKPYNFLQITPAVHALWYPCSNDSVHFIIALLYPEQRFLFGDFHHGQFLFFLF